MSAAATPTEQQLAPAPEAAATSTAAGDEAGGPTCNANVTLTDTNGDAPSPIVAPREASAAADTDTAPAAASSEAAVEDAPSATEAGPATASSADSAKTPTTTERVLSELLELNNSKHMGTIHAYSNGTNNNTLTATTTIATTGAGNGGDAVSLNATAAAADALVASNKALASSNADAILLSMLDSEIHRLKTAEKITKEGLDRSERDGKRMTVLLAMAHDQLEQHKDRNAALHSSVEALQKEVETLKLQKGAAEEKFSLAVADKRAFEAMSASNGSAKAALTAKLELENKMQEETILRLRADAAALERSRDEDRAMAEVERRKAFELRVALQTRLTTVEEELNFLTEMRQEDAKKTTAREYDLSVVVQTLKKEVALLRGSQDASHRSSFETMSAARIERDALEERVKGLERDLTDARRSGFERSTQLQTLLTAKTEQLEAQEAAAKSREAASETQLQKLITDLRVAQSEVNGLADAENTVRAAHVTELVKIKSELDVRTRELADAAEEVQTLKTRLHQQTIDAAVAKENAANALSAGQREHSARLAAKVNELNTVAVELQWTAEKLTSTEGRLATALSDFETATEKHRKEAAALRQEIDGYKHAVAKLNSHIEDNIENRLLAEQNSNLSAHVEAMKGQIAAMNAALSQARVEMSIGESNNAMQQLGHAEAQIARLGALERERAELRPLLDTLALYFRGSTSAAGLIAGGTAVPAANQQQSSAAGGGVSSSSPSEQQQQQLALQNQSYLMLMDNSAAAMASIAKATLTTTPTVAGGGHRAASSPYASQRGGGASSAPAAAQQQSFVQSGTIGGLLAIANKSVVGGGELLAAAVANGALSSSQSAAGGGVGANRNVSFEKNGGGNTSAALVNSSVISNNTLSGRYGANNTSTAAGVAAGVSVDDGQHQYSAVITPDLMLQLRAEEAAVQRSIEGFYRRFGVSGGAGGGAANGGGNAVAANASATAMLTSSLPMIPTTRIKRVN